MPASAPQVYAVPFDAVASRYDETFTSSRIGRAQRSAVWADLTRTFHAGDHVLEIGCGTGVDACFLADQGVRVTACDSSSQMIEIARRRISDKGLQEFTRVIQLPAENLANLRADQQFDGAFSNF